MDWTERWTIITSSTNVGKRVSGQLYIHVSALPGEVVDCVRHAARVAEVDDNAFSVVRFDCDQPRLGLLAYPGFFEEAFPMLAASWTVDLARGLVASRTYDSGASRPVLHRKELLLSPDHPRVPEFSALTAEAESAGLFTDSAIIGRSLSWEEELRARGLRVEGHRLVRAEPGSSRSELNVVRVARHRTALSRSSLSTPMQALWRHGFLDGKLSVFDYGCGRGDDLASLTAMGVPASGWDPYFRPEGERAEADVVNLGFVLNVIEDLEERREALLGAFKLTRRVLSVSALIGGRTAYERFRLFQDGVLTSRGTFQKYFTQPELATYLAEALEREPIPVAPGLYFIFKDDEAEQDFLERRQRCRTTGALPAQTRAPRPPRPPQAPRTRKAPAPSRWEQHAELLDGFWSFILELGRLPDAGEFPEEGKLRESVGTPRRVFNYLVEQRGSEELDAARARRRADLLVYLALNIFERRRSLGALSPRLRRDIKEHWGSHANAMEEARQALFSLGKTETVVRACEQASARDLGYLTPGESLQLDAPRVNQLPALLRIYVGCAARLYGDVESADLIKIHIGSGKLSIMHYDDFEGSPIPNLIERVKIDLRRQVVDFFQYDGEHFPHQPLYLKSRYLDPNSARFPAQAAFDLTLKSLVPLVLHGYGPPPSEFRQILASTDLEIVGFSFQRKQ